MQAETFPHFYCQLLSNEFVKMTANSLKDNSSHCSFGISFPLNRTVLKRGIDNNEFIDCWNQKTFKLTRNKTIETILPDLLLLHLTAFQQSMSGHRPPRSFPQNTLYDPLPFVRYPVTLIEALPHFICMNEVSIVLYVLPTYISLVVQHVKTIWNFQSGTRVLCPTVSLIPWSLKLIRNSKWYGTCCMQTSNTSLIRCIGMCGFF